MPLPEFITDALKQPDTKAPEQPKGEAPKETPKVETPAEQPKGEVLKEQPKAEEPKPFDFKSIDERIATPEDIKKFLSERDTYFSELEETKNKLSQYDGYIKPYDEEVAKLNELKAKGGNVELFLNMRKIDPQSLSDVDAVKLMYQNEGLTSQGADRKVNVLYKVGKDLNAMQAQLNEAKDPNSTNYDLKEASRLEEEMENIYLAQDELKAAGAKAKKALGELKTQSMQVPDFEKIQTEVRNTWTPHVSKFIPKDISIPFKVENPDKSVTELNVKFALDADVEKDVNSFLEGSVDWFTSQGIPYDEKKAKETLTKEVEYKILGKNFQTIATRMVNAAIEAERNRVKDAIHSTQKAGEKTEGKGEEKDAVATQFFQTVKGFNGRF